ncbi:MAG: type secretion exporter [Myxococcales bacterium]|nr:type secretion exporter [Myxococcales bacterium]
MEHRPFPPSARRLGLAQQAGLTGASPVVVGAIACVVMLAVMLALGRAAVATIGAWITAACTGEATLTPDGLATTVIELAAPILAGAAFAAVVAHVAQTRALWLPRRRIPDAPLVHTSSVRRAAFELASAAIIALVAVAWLRTNAPRIAALTIAPIGGGAWLVASFLVALAIAWVAIGTLDALLRRAELAASLAMTKAEKREDDRMSAADPRWRARRLAIARGPAISDAVAGAAVLLLGDDAAVAIAWNPTRQPIPLRTASGRRARATQLLGLARRHRIPVHRDPDLAAALAGDGPVPERHWSRLAEIIAALRRG